MLNSILISDTLREKISGSSDMEVQRSFLNARFYSKHGNIPWFIPLIPELSWAYVKSFVL